jgi:hypothetical protein
MTVARLRAWACTLCALLFAVGNATKHVVDTDNIKKVHLVQSNHFDAGFADFLPRIMNRYFTGEEGTVGPPLPKNQTTYYQSFFLTAGHLAEEFKQLQNGTSYKYMTQSWLVDFFMDCPQDFPYVPDTSIYPHSTPLKCPNASTLAMVKKYVENGDIYWHSFPHNAQPELMNQAFLARGVQSSQNLAKKYNAPQISKVLSQRDVPGLTLGSIVPLVDNGVIGISIGANDFSPPPIVPSTMDCYVKGLRTVRTPFLWKDVHNNKSIIVDIHPGGYGGITGGIDTATGEPYYSRDGTLCDCIGTPDLDEVLCYAWRGDNYGPPTSLNETSVDFELFQKQFPNAEIIASTLTNYFELLNADAVKENLPVLTSEIGDTWMYGVPSDPFKVGAMRVIMREYEKYMVNSDHQGKAKQKNTDTEALEQFFRYAIKLTEHTWGGCGSSHMNVTRPTNIWTSSELDDARKSGTVPFIVKEELSWHEQRKFIDKCIEQLGNLPLAKNIQNELDILKSAYPTDALLTSTGYVEVTNPQEWESLYKLGSNYMIAFDKKSGAVSRLREIHSNVEWASAKKPLLRFMYRSHSLEEASNYPHIYNYNHGGKHPYHEPVGTNFYPGMNRTKNIAKQWYGNIVAMWILRNTGSEDGVHSIIVKLKLDADTINQLGYGAPSEIMLNVTANGGDSFSVELIWQDKIPTRLFETIWLEVRPALSQADHWSLLVNKIGSAVNSSDVVNKGGSSLHGVDPSGGITFQTTNSKVNFQQTLNIKSWDCGVVAPGYNTNPWKYDIYDDGNAVNPVDGAAFFLYGNLYNTNYVLWYPFTKEDHVSRFRFEFNFAVVS